MTVSCIMSSFTLSTSYVLLVTVDLQRSLPYEITAARLVAARSCDASTLRAQRCLNSSTIYPSLLSFEACIVNDICSAL